MELARREFVAGSVDALGWPKTAPDCLLKRPGQVVTARVEQNLGLLQKLSGRARKLEQPPANGQRWACHRGFRHVWHACRLLAARGGTPQEGRPAEPFPLRVCGGSAPCIDQRRALTATPACLPARPLSFVAITRTGSNLQSFVSMKTAHTLAQRARSRLRCRRRRCRRVCHRWHCLRLLRLRLLPDLG